MSLALTIGAAKAIMSATGLDDQVQDWIGDKIGVKTAEKITTIAKAVTGHTDASAMSLEERSLVRAGIEREESEIRRLSHEDRVDARSMQVKVVQSDAGWFAKNFVYLFAAAWALFAMGYLAAITFMEVANERAMDTALGFLLGTVVTGIVQFFYGSSSGSKTKTKILQRKQE